MSWAGDEASETRRLGSRSNSVQRAELQAEPQEFHLEDPKELGKGERGREGEREREQNEIGGHRGGEIGSVSSNRSAGAKRPRIESWVLS